MLLLLLLCAVACYYVQYVSVPLHCSLQQRRQSRLTRLDFLIFDSKLLTHLQLETLFFYKIT